MVGALLNDMVQLDDESVEKILISLLDVKGIETKTEIQKPLNLARLETIQAWLELENMEKSAKVLKAFIYSYRVNMVSHKRKSREEIIHALSQRINQEKTLTDKLVNTGE